MTSFTKPLSGIFILKNYLRFSLGFLLFISIFNIGNSQNCIINDLTGSIFDCANGQFYIQLSFEYDNTSDSFTVAGNGNNYGTFSYSSLPLDLGPLDENSTPYEFVVIDSDDPNCSDFIDVGIVDCDSMQACEIWDLVVDFDECTSDSTYRIILNFNHAGTGGLGFDLWANGDYFDFYSYNSLPLTINNFPLADGMTNGLLVCDNDNANCCEDAGWPTPNCNNGGDCEIDNVSVEILDCDNGIFYAQINFDYANVGDSFHIDGNGVEYGNFSYDDIPVVLGPLVADQTNYEFVVIDNLSMNCSDFIGVGIVDCDSMQTCEIWDLVVDFDECTSDSTYRIVLNFNHAGTGGLGFDLWANGDYFEFYSYNSLPLTINNFPLGDGPVNGLFVCDNDNPNCCEDATWTTPNCNNEECSIDNVTVGILECENGVFYAQINFDYMNVGDSFHINGNGMEYGNFSYNDVPVVLGPLSTGSTNYEFVVIDNVHMNCQDFIDLGQVTCDSNVICDIFDLNVEIGECTSDSTYSIILDFEYSGTTNNFFDLWANGDFFGFYEFSSLPLTINNFPLGIGNVDFLMVCENDNPDCCAGAEWLSPNCDGACDIYDLLVEEVDCGNGVFYLEIDFEYNHVGDSFKVVGNGHNYGHFSYADLPIVIGPLSVNTLVNEIGVIDLTFPDCGEDTGVTIDCGNSNCDLSGLEVAVGDIVTDSTFELTFNFNHANTSDSFNAFSGNQYVGTFAYADLPITIPEFPTRGLDYELLRVCDAEFMDCCAVIEFMVDDCESCDISDVSVEVLECDGNLVFVEVDFNIAHGSDAGFEIVGNGHNYGQFSYDDVPVIISFEFNPGDFVDLIIRDLLDPNCVNYTFVNEVDCDEECELSNLSTSLIECTSDSTYNVTIDFEYTGTGGLGFDLFANGDFFGFYGYSELPLQVEDFPTDGVQVDLLQVCDNDNPNCCTQVSIPIPSCITGIQDPDQLNGLKILSSPGQWEIQVSQPGVLELYDIAGKQVQKSLEVRDAAIISNLSDGIYIVTWSGAWGVVSKKALFVNK